VTVAKIAQPPPAPAAAPLRLPLIAAVLIAAAAFLAYADSLTVPFLFDDQMNIVDNPYIRLTRLAPDQLLRAMVQDKNQLRPFSNLTFALDYYFHGLNPRLMHLENVALHAASALLLFALLLRLLPPGVAADERRLTIAAALAAAAWALSPAHTQAVTYLVQRQTLMASAFTLASVYCWARGRPGACKAWFAGAAVAFVAAAGSKESGFLAPLYWLLLEPLLPGSPARRLRGRTAALGLAAAAAVGLPLLAALWLSGMLGGFADLYREQGYGPVARLLTEARVVISYLITIVLPIPPRLALDHEVAVSSGLFHPWTTLPAVLIVLGSAGLALAQFQRRPALSVCIAGYLLALAPESSIVPVELMNDHRLYLASLFVVPPLMALAALRLPARPALPLILAVLVLLGGLTALRNRTWQDPARLWADSAAKSPSLYRPWSNLCGALTASGEFRAALSTCDAAISRNPPGPMPLIDRGIALMQLGAQDEAGRDFAAAARRWPQSAPARFNYGAWLFAADRDAEALAEVSRALELDPFLAPAYLLRARVHLKLGRPAPARADLALLLRLYPENQEAMRLLEEVGGR
jgi:hypothetical protein